MDIALFVFAIVLAVVAVIGLGLKKNILFFGAGMGAVCCATGLGALLTLTAPVETMQWSITNEWGQLKFSKPVKVIITGTSYPWTINNIMNKTSIFIECDPVLEK